MIVVGFVLICAFAAIERWVVPKPMLPYNLLLSRNVLGACLLTASLFVAYFCWDGYYSSYLQVVHGLTLAEAGYVNNIYSIGACFVAFPVGWLLRKLDGFKIVALCALPVQILGGGLMIHFRQPDTPVGYVVMCQIFIALGGGTLVVCSQMAVMAVAKHGEVASLLALLYLSSSIGAGIGSSVSGAIWTNTLLPQLMERLPAEVVDQAEAIYGDLELQIEHPIGDPIRDAINAAYGETQRRMCIAGTAVFVLAIAGVVMWRDVKLSTVKQVRGRVF